MIYRARNIDFDIVQITSQDALLFLASDMHIFQERSFIFLSIFNAICYTPVLNHHRTLKFDNPKNKTLYYHIVLKLQNMAPTALYK